MTDEDTHDDNILASPELMLFFTHLLELKRFVYDKAQESKEGYYTEIYERLDAILKEAK